MNVVKFKLRADPKARAAKFVDAPLPRKPRIGSSDWYNWQALRVGGPALFISNQKTKDVRKTANAAAERHGMKFEVRNLIVDGVPGAGVWRTE